MSTLFGYAVPPAVGLRFRTNPFEPIYCAAQQEAGSQAASTPPLEAKSELTSNLCPLIARRWNLESLPREKFFETVESGWWVSEVSRKQR